MVYLTIIGGIFITWLILVFFFTPGIKYHVSARVDAGSPRFQYLLESSCQAVVHHRNRIEILTDGAAFYPAMLQAIRGATRSVNMECYIFQPGAVADRFVAALAERGRAGVDVTLVVDAIGSAGLSGRPLALLKEAGCRVETYQRITWYRLARLNNRTHRELLIVDGSIAFVGGAGIADWWSIRTEESGPWRDTMARVEGPVVAALQGVFAENWLECCGEILTGSEHFPDLVPAGETTAFVVKSSPSDRATVSRVVFQVLLEGSSRRVSISTPYFLPDRAFRDVLKRTVARGVAVTVVVPGRNTDQHWVRLASRRLYGELLESRLRIYEYDPSMTHVKALIVDGLWAVIGTTNFDNRSFEHNDEVNLMMRDAGIAARLQEDFDRDTTRSREVTLDMWRRRPILEKLVGRVAWILERQQ